MIDKEKIAFQDTDPTETKEWLDALDAVSQHVAPERASFLIQQLLNHAKAQGIALPKLVHTPYINTISPRQEAKFPQNDLTLLEDLTHYLRWNALAIVMRAGKKKAGLGGHISTYASIATLFEVALNYFLHAEDLVFFQGHAAEGLYARAFLEGRLTEEQLINFRQEIFSPGLSSYPHPYLMPNFWQFPTVSMGLGPLMAVYQAQMLKYLHNRQLADVSHRKVWVFCGDGEMGEPESQGALLIAAKEHLNNLIFVVNCNLQRLDGPVSGNGQIIQELEGLFQGAGWRVIKVIWGSNWDTLFQKDTSGILLKRISELVDGEYQNYTAKDGAYMREHFFGRYPELAELVSDYSDDQLKQLQDGGHDPQKVYAAYVEALTPCSQPTVILAKTIKGYGYGKEGEGLNITHNLESLSQEGLQIFRDRFGLPLSEQQLTELAFYKPPKDSPVMCYLQQQRKKLGGFLPARHPIKEALKVPSLELFASLLEGSKDRSISTSMVFGRVLMVLLKDPVIKDRIVPIVADEARTLSLDSLFRQIGIYAVAGQQYTPEDHQQLLYYREIKEGQVLQQGISEAGAMSSWIAVATSYANVQTVMIPFYTYYAMFGYQRVGDLIWAAGDMKARGFLLGGLAGRTTLAGEGLQHQDSHNLLMFGVVPTCISYDPTFGYEVAVIIQDGLRRMYQEQENIFYYLTLMNENYQHPPMPKGVEEGILKGIYLFKPAKKRQDLCVQLFGSGAILREVIRGAELLEEKYGIDANVWSVTSFNLLRRDIESVARHNLLNPKAKQKSYLTSCLQNHPGPIIAATDYMRLYADQIRQAIDRPYYVLGTDGFGRSDTRPNLRKFFEVDANMIAYTALKALTDQGKYSQKDLLAAGKDLQIDPARPDPWIA